MKVKRGRIVLTLGGFEGAEKPAWEALCASWTPAEAQCFLDWVHETRESGITGPVTPDTPERQALAETMVTRWPVYLAIEEAAIEAANE